MPPEGSLTAPRQPFVSTAAGAGIVVMAAADLVLVARRRLPTGKEPGAV